MPLHPFARCIKGFAPMLRETRTNAAHHRSVDSDAADDRLAFRQCRKLGEHCTPRALDRLCDGLLIDRIYDAHDDLRHALRQNILIELTRPLRNEADANAKL